jgi:hypothetical protein
MRRWLVYLLVVSSVLLIQFYSEALPLGALVFAIVIAAVFVVLTVMSSMSGTVNPLGVYLLLILGAMAAWAWVRALSALGPIGLLVTIIVLAGVTTWLSLTRGDALRRRRENATHSTRARRRTDSHPTRRRAPQMTRRSRLRRLIRKLAFGSTRSGSTSIRTWKRGRGTRRIRWSSFDL